MNLPIQTNFLFSSKRYGREKRTIIFLERGKTEIFIDEIVMCQGEGNYTFVHYKNGSKRLFSKTLKQFCELFEAHDFVRVSRSFLINLRYLKAFSTTGEPCVIMIDGQKIDIARRRKVAFQNIIRQFTIKSIA
ncbi:MULTISPECIES: LytTR family DNA-binding domain-containing protein [unclassified Arcicella]|uniref:LytR/AlgR family response regulator transcription factor n=1 Tax=unclassified Arcicella TaxID=2644986 RepID=UPI00285E0BF1|nr:MULTISPECIES: LytTR family DNA-binding domain-containing protein [unclassified Arcicella]MDR6562875.1 two-component system LytT family response regulator [Arcicella sp. BE51]MDR6812784.1 two-component system LytT family response regulator [Arcicella sp. BE140]MDR6824096.1 two-component system LytT family response regulator [Arcicella sp. BE139]